MRDRSGVARLTVLLALIWSCAALAAQPTERSPKLALWVRAAALKNLAALAEVQLASDSQVQLVERQVLDKALEEQALSKLGLIDANHAVEAGRLVATDLLAMIEGDAQDGALVVFDAHSGVRLCDVAFHAAAGQEAAAQVVTDGLKEALAKRERGAASHLLCVHTVRNADLPHTADPLCKAVAAVLQRRLCALKDVSVLERARLDTITAEHRLTGADAVLSGAPVLLDLELARAGTNQVPPQKDEQGRDVGAVILTVIARNVNGAELGRIASTVKRLDPNSAADALLPKLADVLKLSAPSSSVQVDAYAEAAQFERETILHWEHHEIPEALESAEAAHAILPDDLRLMKLRACALAAQGASLYCHFVDVSEATAGQNTLSLRWPQTERPPFELGLSYTRNALDQLEVWHARALSRHKIWRYDPLTQRALFIIRHSLYQLRKKLVESQHPRLGQVSLYLTESEAAAYERACAQFGHYRHDVELATFFDQISDKESFEFWQDFAYYVMNDSRCIYSRNGQQWTTEWKQITSQWLQLVAQYESEPPAGLISNGEAWSPPLLGPLGLIPSGGSIGAGSQVGDWSDSDFSFNVNMTPDDWKRYASIYELVLAKLPTERNKVLLEAVASAIDSKLRTAVTPAQQALARVEPHELHGAPVVPGATVGPGTVWKESKLLFDLAHSHGIVSLGFPCVDPIGKRVYAVFNTNRLDRPGGFCSFDLQGGPPRILMTFDRIREPRMTPNFDVMQTQLRRGIAFISGKHYVLHDPGTGIYIFELDGSSKRIVTREALQLPADNFQAATVLDKTLYFALGSAGIDGYLYGLDLETGALETLAASRRIAGARPSPFDNDAPLFVSCLVPDAAAHRVFLIAFNPAWTAKKNGLWCFDCKTKQFSQLRAIPNLKYERLTNDSTRWAMISRNRLFTINGSSVTWLSLAPHPATEDFSPMGAPDDWWAPSPSLPALPLYETEHWYWGRFGRVKFSEVRDDQTRNPKVERLQLFDPPTKDSFRVGYWPPFLTPISDNEVVAGDGSHLWRLHIPEDADDLKAVQRRVEEVGRPVLARMPPPSGGNLPWSEVRTVYDVLGRGVGPQALLRPLILDKAVYALACGSDPDFRNDVEVYRFSLKDGSSSVVAKGTIFDSVSRFDHDGLQGRLKDLAAVNARYYCYFQRYAAYVFDLHRGTMQAVNFDPPDSFYPSGMAFNSTGELLICGGKRAARSQPDDKPQKALSPALLKLDCSTLKLEDIPLPLHPHLELADEYGIGPMVADPERGRVVFFVMHDHGEGDEEGLFEFDGKRVQKVAGLAVRKQLPHDLFSFYLNPYIDSQPVKDGVWVSSLYGACLEVNFKTIRMRTLYSRLNPSTSMDFSPPMAALGSWTYYSGFGRLRNDGSVWEQFAPLRHISPGEGWGCSFLQPTEDGSGLIAADDCGMWILKMNDAPAPPEPPSPPDQN